MKSEENIGGETLKEAFWSDRLDALKWVLMNVQYTVHVVV